MIGTIYDLAKRPDMPSEWAIRRIIKRRLDFPLVRRGTHGRAYLVDIEQAERFLLQLGNRPSPAPTERSEMIKELGLEMLAEAEQCDAE